MVLRPTPDSCRNRCKRVHGVHADRSPRRVPGGRSGRVRARVAVRAALFITCFKDTLFPQVGRATVALLERLGVEVDFPREQTCCGKRPFNPGYQLEAAPLALRFVLVFAEAEGIVCPSASCAGM